MEKEIITITEVKTPWYGLSIILKRAFKKSTPEYSKIEGLISKFYHITDDRKGFGGIYLWKNRQSAEKLFNEDWFERVRAKLKCEGKVEYYELVESKTISSNIDFAKRTNTMSILIKTDSAKATIDYSNSKGLLNRFNVLQEQQEYMILLFEDSKHLYAFLELNNPKVVKTYSTPVILVV